MMKYAKEAQKLRNWVATQAWLSEMDKTRYTAWAEDFEVKAKEQSKEQISEQAKAMELAIDEASE